MKQIKIFLSQYNTGFWFFLAGIFVAAASMLYISNEMGIAERGLKASTEKNAALLAQTLSTIQKTADGQTDLLQAYLDESGASAPFAGFEKAYLSAMNEGLSQKLAVEAYYEPVEMFSVSFLDFAASGSNWFYSANQLLLAEPLHTSGGTLSGFVFVSVVPEVLVEITFAQSDNTSQYMLLSSTAGRASDVRQIVFGEGDAPLLTGENFSTDKAVVTQYGDHGKAASILLPNGFVFAEIEKDFTAHNKINMFIILLAVATALFVFLTHPNKLYNSSPFQWLSDKVTKNIAKDKEATILMNNIRTVFLTHLGLLAANALYVVYLLVSGAAVQTTSFYLVLLAVLLIAMIFHIKNIGHSRFAYVFTFIYLLLPPAATLLSGGVVSGSSANFYLWIYAALFLSMFLVKRNHVKAFTAAFIFIIFAAVSLEMLFIAKDSAQILLLMQFAANFLFVAFILFGSLDVYISRSLENYSVLENVYMELKGTQSLLVQREKMVTLGQLIAGVAHEINTPMGAIKASAEVLESSATSVLSKVIRSSKDFSEDDLNCFITLTRLSNASIQEMRSTMEVRRGKQQMRKYFESIGQQNGPEICDMLAKLEISCVEKVERNIDIFQRENILNVLAVTVSVVPFLNSTQSIKFASDRVSKIVFALKTYSHMNPTGELMEIDIVKNLDNVLVLYHNQLKAGVELIKEYDENIHFPVGNPDELSQVWTNIIQNAIHAMNQVGRLTISAKNISDQAVSVSFTDTGKGIPKEHLDKIFEPFFTTKPLGEGSGLGLDICKKVIQSQGGDIHVDSTVGVGTTFTVILPTRECLDAAGKEAVS